MKAAVVKSNSNIEIKNIENQSVGPGDILVKMRACGICGSDVEKVFGKYGQPSMRLGHEPAGTIMEVGSKISNCHMGIIYGRLEKLLLCIATVWKLVTSK